MGDFEACRFDFRIDNKTGLTPSKRKKSERRNVNYNTLFKCKICGSLFESRPALLEHKLEHNVLKCPVCNIKFPKRSLLREHVSIAHGEHCAKSETIAKMLAHASRNKRESTKQKLRHHTPSPPSFYKEDVSENCLEPLPEPSQRSTEPHVMPITNSFPPQMQMLPPPPAIPSEQPVLSPQPNVQPHQMMTQMMPMSSPLASPTQCHGAVGSNSQVPGMVYINLPIYIGPQNAQAQGQSTTLPEPSHLQQTMAPLPTMPLPAMPEEALQRPKEELVKVKTEPVDSIPDTQLPTSMQFYRQEELEPGEIRNNVEYGNRADAMIPTSVITVAPNSHYSDSFPYSNKPPTDAVAALRMANAKSPAVRARLNFDQTPLAAVEECGAIDFSLKSEKRKNEEGALDLTCKNINKKIKAVEDDRIAMLKEYKVSSRSSPDVSELGVALSSQGSCNSSRSHTPESFAGQTKRKGRAGGLNNLVAKLWQTKATLPAPRQDRNTNHSPNICGEEVLDQRVGLLNQSSGSDMPPIPMREDFFSTSPNGSPVPNPGLDFTSKLPRLGSRSDVCVEENTSEQLSEESLRMKIPLTLGSNNNGTTLQQSPKKVNDYCTIKFHTCRVCKQLFDSAEKMWEHAVTHEDFHKYRCSLCKYVTACKSDLVQHKLNEHGVSNAVRNFVDYSKEFKNTQKTDDNGHNVGGSTYSFSMKDLNGSTPKGRLVCDYPGCGKTFREWRHLKVHGTLHTGEKPLACSLCDYACRHRSSMNWHMKSRHGLEKMKTQGNRTVYVDSKGKVICGSTEELKIEMYTSSKLPGSPLKKQTIDSLVLPDNCVNTSEIAAMQNAYNEQICNTDQPNTAFVIPTAPEEESEDDDSNPMGITNIKSEANEEFLDHDDQDSIVSSLSKEKPVEEPQFYTSVMKLKYMGLPGGGGEENKHQICPICKQFFESAEKMWEHRMKEHEEQTKIFCETCGWDADNKEELESHMLSTHGKEIGEFKDFICTICGKGYSSKTGLNHHMLRHSEEGPPQFTCPYRGCVSKLHSKGALKNHIRRVHLKVAPKFACPQLGCSRRFDSVSALRGHQVLHSDERPLMCDYPGCDKSFRESKHLKVHRMQHTDERPLRCELCDYSCRRRNSMNWHMKSKHQMEKQVTPDGRTIYYPC